MNAVSLLLYVKIFSPFKETNTYYDSFIYLFFTLKNVLKKIGISEELEIKIYFLHLMRCFLIDREKKKSQDSSFEKKFDIDLF